MNTPLIVRVYVEQTAFDMDAIDANVYCINDGDTELEISSKSESYTTIDEDSGEAATHGSKSKSFILQPNKVKLIAQVQGWEWDGHVGMEITCKETGSLQVKKLSYDFKRSKANYIIKSLNLSGRIIPALKY